MSTVGAEIEKKFQEIQKHLQSAYEADKKDIEEHHSFWDEVGNAIKNFFTEPSFMLPVFGPAGTIVSMGFTAKQASDAAANFLKEADKYAKEAFNAAHDYWDKELREHAEAGAMLKEKSRQWQEQQSRAMESMVTVLTELEKKPNGEGDWHEAYKKAIPSQRGALLEMQKMVKRSAKTYEQGDAGLNSIFVSVSMRCSSVSAAMQQHKPTNPEQWAMRLRWAKGELDGLMSALESRRDYLTEFDRRVADEQKRIHDSALGSAPFVKGGGWPEAKGDTTKMAPTLQAEH